MSLKLTTKVRPRGSALKRILVRLKNGEIDTKAAYAEIEAYDRKHDSRLDLITEVLAS